KRTQYKRLSHIAPTFVPEQDDIERGQWQELTRFYAHALGQQDKAQQLLDDINARAQELSARIGDDAPDAMVVRWMPQGPVVMSDQIFSSDVLASAGFNVDDNNLVGDSRPHSDPLSLEILSRIDGDWLFLATLNADGDDALAHARKSPAFQRLNVAQNDHVVAVDGQLWSSTMGPLAAHAILDDIENALQARGADTES